MDVSCNESNFHLSGTSSELTKADKLNRKDGAAALTKARRELRDEASAQLFSATKNLEVDKARRRLEEFLHSQRRRAS